MLFKPLMSLQGWMRCHCLFDSWTGQITTVGPADQKEGSIGPLQNMKYSISGVNLDFKGVQF